MNPDYRYLTEAEKELFSGLDTPRAKALKEGGVRKALGDILGMETTVKLEDGREVTVNNAQIAAAKAYASFCEKPDVAKLKDMAAIMGENKVQLEAKVETGSDVFLGFVKEDNGTDSQ